MQILKGFALGLAGFFLFLALFFLGPIFTVNNTLLNPEFMTAEAQQLDISSIIREEASKELDTESQAYLSAIDKTVTENTAWLDEQIHKIITAGYAYLRGETDTINQTISLSPIRESLANNLTEAYLKNPPPSYMQLSDSEKKSHLSDIKQQFIDVIPNAIQIDAKTIGVSGMQDLQQARDIIGYLRTAYYVLIVLSIVLIGAIILILRQTISSCRTLGILFIIPGALGAIASTISILVSKAFVNPGDLPATIQTWLPHVIQRVLTPWLIFSVIVLLSGIILLVAAFFIGKKLKPVTA